MQLLIQQIIDGLSAGVIYGALALAMVLIFKATRIVNFGQGEMATFCAYLAWQFHEWGAPAWLSLAGAAILAFLLGIGVFRTVVKPVSNAPVETLVVITLGLFLAFQALCLWLWGSDALAFPKLFDSASWHWKGIRFTSHLVGSIATLSVASIALAMMFHFTRLGRAMRATAESAEKSTLVAIPVETMLMLGWGLASVIGFIAAVLAAPQLFLSPIMMTPVLIYALAAATIGGWDSAIGAIVGGLAIGVMESVGATYLTFIGAELRLTIPLILALLFLMIRPAGLFGRKALVRV